MLIPGRVCAFVLVAFAVLAAGCPNGAGITCPNGQAFCNGRCTYVANDPQNCGQCGNVCPGLLVCINGSCGCPPNQTNCADTCVDVNVDPNNCGTCGQACVAGQLCASGACATTCGVNLMQCTNLCIDVQNDPKNCGMCGNACAATDICCGGSCVTSGTDAHCMGCVACPAGMTCVNFVGGDMGNVCGQPG
jgi:hypothetical protein